jgi:renalase
MTQNPNSQNPKVLVIGAGISGSGAARALASSGIDVEVWDKGRGAGGRLSTRRTALGSFNHGTTAFTVGTQTIDQEVNDWRHAGLIETTPEAGMTLVKANGAMNGLVKHLHRGLNVLFKRRVTSLTRESGHWRVLTDQGLPTFFDHVLLAIPAPQACGLAGGDSGMVRQLTCIRYAPAWVVMVSSDAVGAIPRDHPAIDRIDESFVGACIHLTPAASLEYVEHSSDDVLALFDLASSRPTYLSAHRWRFSQVDSSIEERFLTDQYGLVSCGDGFGGAGVEAALLSGKAAAQHLIGRINEGQSPSAT